MIWSSSFEKIKFCAEVWTFLKNGVPVIEFWSEFERRIIEKRRKRKSQKRLFKRSNLCEPQLKPPENNYPFLDKIAEMRNIRNFCKKTFFRPFFWTVLLDGPDCTYSNLYSTLKIKIFVKFRKKTYSMKFWRKFSKIIYGSWILVV